MPEKPESVPSLLSVDEVRDLASLVKKLSTTEADPVSAFLWSKFSAESQRLLTDRTSTEEAKKSVLITQLNSVITGPPFHQKQRFAGVTLSEQVFELISQNPVGRTLIRLNRLLLEGAYPLEIVASPDVFISYTHSDDDSPLTGLPGWITEFNHALEHQLISCSGNKDIEVWWDKRELEVGDAWDEKIVANLCAAKVLVSILSPPYVQSTYCRKELLEFCTHAQKSGRLKVRQKYRVFPVFKRYVDRFEYEPPAREVLRDSQAIKFYDEKTKDPHEPYGDEEKKLRSFKEVGQVAQEINEVLRMLDLNKTGQTVYLAETSTDLKEQRDMIKSELVQRGYNVLPDETLPTVAAEIEKRLIDYLEKSQISIHLIGTTPGFTPEGTDQTVDEIQNTFAAKRSAEGRLCRYIWLRPGLKPSGRHAQFVDRFFVQPELQTGSEIIKSTVENLKEEVLSRLARLRTAKAAIYLAETTRDRKDDREMLSKALLEQGYAVLPEQPLYTLVPDQPLPALIGSDLAKRIDAELQQCHCSIHMIGRSYGLIPEDEEKERSVVELQYDLAANQAQKRQLKRLVWIPRDLVPAEERQKEFITRLIHEPDHQTGFEVLRDSFKRLEEVVFQRITGHEKPEPNRIATQVSVRKQIYLAYHEADLKKDSEIDESAFQALRALTRFLQNQGFDVQQPDFEADEPQMREIDQRNLRRCDAAMIFWGVGTRTWVEDAVSDIRKAQGYREEPMLVQAVFIGPPDKANKELYSYPDGITIRQSGQFSPDMLAEFLTKAAGAQIEPAIVPESDSP